MVKLPNSVLLRCISLVVKWFMTVFMFESYNNLGSFSVFPNEVMVVFFFPRGDTGGSKIWAYCRWQAVEVDSKTLAFWRRGQELYILSAQTHLWSCCWLMLKMLVITCVGSSKDWDFKLTCLKILSESVTLFWPLNTSFRNPSIHCRRGVRESLSLCEHIWRTHTMIYGSLHFPIFLI